MAITIDTTSISAIRFSFLVMLLAQLNIPLYPTYFDYVYPSNYLTNKGACTSTIFGFCISWMPKACDAGPTNTLPIFDYIIVGAGPTGTTIAYRLANAFTSRSVLLIEKGNAPPVDVVTPQWFPFNLKISCAYNYTAEKKFMNIVDDPTTNTYNRTITGNDRYGLGYTNGLPFDAGKALGGGTAINGMLFVCGTSNDYDGWKNVTGDASWGWGTGSSTIDGMLSYLKRLTTLNDPNLSSTCQSYYGTTGPLTVSDPASNSSIIPIIRAAAQEVGYPILADINCGKWIGFAYLHATIKNKERNHAARALLAPLRLRNNLMVMRDTTVAKVNLVGNLGGTVTATGVSVTTSNPNCSSFSIRASREIILSAGSLNSPLILQRSGVGRAVDLTPFGIAQKIDRPAGLNLHDHPFSLHFFKTNASAAEIQASNDQITTLAGQALDYVLSRTGPFTYVGNMMFSAFINTNDATINPTSNPNVQWIFYLFDYRQSELSDILLTKFGISSQYAQEILAANQNYKILMAFNILLNPISRGVVQLRGTDPNLPPKIYANYLSDVNGIDESTLTAGIGKLQQLFSTTAMTSVSASMIKFNITECNPIPYPSSAYWKCYYTYLLQNLWHPAGTCKMGKATDLKAVVDPTLKVLGITGAPRVRVADASIMPQITSGNTQCPCYLIGEKAAAMVLATP